MYRCNKTLRLLSGDVGFIAGRYYLPLDRADGLAFTNEQGMPHYITSPGWLDHFTLVPQ